jgi:hypothetical protein
MTVPRAKLPRPHRAMSKEAAVGHADAEVVRRRRSSPAEGRDCPQSGGDESRFRHAGAPEPAPRSTNACARVAAEQPFRDQPRNASDGVARDRLAARARVGGRRSPRFNRPFAMAVRIVGRSGARGRGALQDGCSSICARPQPPSEVEVNLAATQRVHEGRCTCSVGRSTPRWC